MLHRCLAEFLEALGQAGELTRMEQEVDPALEAAEIARRAAKAGGPALLFGAVKGHDLPVLCNLFGAEGRIGRALGVDSLEYLAERIARLLDGATSESWLNRLRGTSQADALAGVAPRKVKSAAVQQIVRLGSDVDLGELPLLQAAAEEVGRAIHAATVFSAEPDSHRPVFGRCDLQQLDRTRLAVCWAADDVFARLMHEYRARDQKMPLAVVLGGDPALMLATAAPLPASADVCALAGLLRDKPLDVAGCRSVDLDVPAEAEIVLEGFVDPAEPTVMAGPLCGPMGCLTHPWPAPAMQVTTMTHRANPIYVATVPGRPPHEASTTARAMQRVFLPLARLAMPELVDYDLPEFAAARHWAAVSIRKTYPGHGRRAAHAAWRLPPTRFAKVLVIVDEDVDVHDHGQVLAALTANLRPGRDVLVERGPADPFDPVASPGVLGEKMAFDATRKLIDELA